MSDPIIRNVNSQVHSNGKTSSLQGEFYFSLFNQNIKFCADNKATIEYVQACVEYLNTLDDRVIDALCLACIRYRDDFCEMIGKEILALSNPRDVLSQVTPKSLIIPTPEIGDKPVAHLELDCDWEEEHGMEWIIRDDLVLYVGSYNNQNPWWDYSDKDSWNYA